MGSSSPRRWFLWHCPARTWLTAAQSNRYFYAVDDEEHADQLRDLLEMEFPNDGRKFGYTASDAFVNPRTATWIDADIARQAEALQWEDEAEAPAGNGLYILYCQQWEQRWRDESDEPLTIADRLIVAVEQYHRDQSRGRRPDYRPLQDLLIRALALWPADEPEPLAALQLLAEDPRPDFFDETMRQAHQQAAAFRAWVLRQQIKPAAASPEAETIDSAEDNRTPQERESAVLAAIFGDVKIGRIRKDEEYMAIGGWKSRTSLYQRDEIKQALKMARIARPGDVPRGHKHDGQLEAWRDEKRDVI